MTAVIHDPAAAFPSIFILHVQVKGLESEVRYQLTEARIVLRRRSVIPLMVRQSIKAPV